MKKVSYYFTLVLLSLGTVLYAQTKQWTLEECVILALEKNITIKQNELNYANAELDKLSAFASFFT